MKFLMLVLAMAVFALAEKENPKDKLGLRMTLGDSTVFICWHGEWAAVGARGIFFEDSKYAAEYGASMVGYTPIKFTRKNPHLKYQEKNCFETWNWSN